jgi:hypothetical protein
VLLCDEPVNDRLGRHPWIRHLPATWQRRGARCSPQSLDERDGPDRGSHARRTAALR